MAKKMKQSVMDIPAEKRTPEEKLAAMRTLDKERRAKCHKLDATKEICTELKTEIEALTARILTLVEESDRDPLPFEKGKEPGYRADLDGPLDPGERD